MTTWWKWTLVISFVLVVGLAVAQDLGFLPLPLLQ
jgi:hypothetical protein